MTAASGDSVGFGAHHRLAFSFCLTPSLDCSLSNNHRKALTMASSKKKKRPGGYPVWLWVVLGVFALSALSNLGSDTGSALSTLLFVAAFVAVPALRHYRMTKFFDSEEFQAQRASLAAVVREHNDIANYVDEIWARGRFNLGTSSTGAYSHLATSSNTSNWNYQRDRNVADLSDPHVHNTSLQVVRNATADPLKYLMKYFDLGATEENLARIEKFGESIASLESAIANLHDREAAISRSINPPAFILKHYHQRFMDEVGIELSPIKVTYPVYKFQYVSAGGNSGQETAIQLNPQAIDALIETMSEKIRWRMSAAGQRALMTTRLRNFIKERDNHTCRLCSVSLAQEPHLLLEVDHITPVSRGGLTTEENLQTLCWRCNRTKSNKMPA